MTKKFLMKLIRQTDERIQLTSNSNKAELASPTAE